jgi:hypothetical protein
MIQPNFYQSEEYKNQTKLMHEEYLAHKTNVKKGYDLFKTRTTYTDVIRKETSLKSSDEKIKEL